MKNKKFANIGRIPVHGPTALRPCNRRPKR